MKNFFRFLFLVIFVSNAVAQSASNSVENLSIKPKHPEDLGSEFVSTSIPRVDLKTIFKMPIGTKGLEFRDYVKQLDNQTVQMSGFIVNSDEPVKGRLLLSVRPINLNEHADGDANDLPSATVYVMLAPSQSESVVSYAQGPHTFQGVLNLGRLEHPDKSISWIRLQLPAIHNP